MSKTLLNGVNDVGKRASLLTSAESLLTIVDPQRQHEIDTIIQVWNECIDELYRLAGDPRPTVFSSGSITLVAGTRAYAIDVAAEAIRWPFMDTTNGNYIVRYPGGYNKLIEDQPQPANYTGLPEAGAIRPDDSHNVTGVYVYLDRTPTSDYAGRVYTYRYETDKELTEAGSIMPFGDTVYRAMVPVVAYIWQYERRAKAIPGDLLKMHLARALKLLSHERYDMDTYWVRRSYAPLNVTDPMPD